MGCLIRSKKNWGCRNHLHLYWDTKSWGGGGELASFTKVTHVSVFVHTLGVFFFFFSIFKNNPNQQAKLSSLWGNRKMLHTCRAEGLMWLCSLWMLCHVLALPKCKHLAYTIPACLFGGGWLYFNLNCLPAHSKFQLQMASNFVIGSTSSPCRTSSAEPAQLVEEYGETFF